MENDLEKNLEELKKQKISRINKYSCQQMYQIAKKQIISKTNLQTLIKRTDQPFIKCSIKDYFRGLMVRNK
jgi:hypothetical protein